MKPILIIAPHDKIAEAARKISQKYEDVEVRLGLLDQAIGIASQVAGSGVEVFISRGGTAQMLEEAFPSIPVVEFAVSPYDLLKAVHQAKSYGKHIMVIGFERVIQGVEQLGPVLDVEITVRRIKHQREAPLYLEQCLKAQTPMDVLMGGALAEALALSYGIPTVFLQTGEAAIENSIKDAQRLMDLQRKERQKTERFKAILHYINQGVVAIDDKGNVTTFNPAASKITGIGQDNIIGRHVSEVIPNDKLVNVMQENRPELGQLQTIGKVLALTNRVPIVVKGRTAGAVATFEDVTKIQEYERTIRSKLRNKGHVARYTFGDILGHSPPLVVAKRLAARYADVDSTVLIAGESGTGKEMFAQSIHKASRRAKGPFVAVNCSAIPSTLLDSELFGYEEGAFTGAQKRGKLGLFAAAHGGTIFLDEITEIATNLQANLLRVIQEREVRPLGSDKVIPINVRIVAATNRNLPEEVKAGRFRSDLYYRLGILNLKIPPLRSRPGDIALLAKYFVRIHSKQLNKDLEITDSALKALESYKWPGNIRELENIVERLCVVSDMKIEEKYVWAFLEDADLTTAQAEASIENVKRQHALRIVAECGGNKTLAARKLGISRTGLWRLLKTGT